MQVAAGLLWRFCHLYKLEQWSRHESTCDFFVVVWRAATGDKVYHNCEVIGQL